jgi:hypothetical protein
VVVPNRIMWPLFDSSGNQLSSGIARISAGGRLRLRHNRSRAELRSRHQQ